MNLNDTPRGGTYCITSAGLAIGDGAKTGVALAGKDSLTIVYEIDGVKYYKDDAATNIPLTAATAQGLLTTCLYLIQINAAGTVSSVKGAPVLTADLAAGSTVLEWPELAADHCPLGAVRMATTTTYNFTAGTTALDATGCSATYYNLGHMPVNPLTA